MSASRKPVPRWWLVVVVALACFFAWHSLRHVTEQNIKADGKQNLTIAYNIAERGVFSQTQPNRPPLPTNLREPVPIWVVAAYLKAFDPPSTPVVAASDLASGPNAAFVKRHNALWVFLAVVGSWMLFHAMTGSAPGALVAATLVYGLFFNSPALVDTLLTEGPATALLVWAAWGLVRASHLQRKRDWLLAGALLGLLALTKGIFLYAALASALAVALVLLIQRRTGKLDWTSATQLLLMLCLGIALTLGPWLVRNRIHFGSFQITEGRGGWVLYKRSLLNHMTDEEFRGAVVLYGPSLVHDLVEGTSWEVRRDDVVLRSGRLRRLHIGASEFRDSDLDAQRAGRPDLAVTYYRQTAATFVKLRKQRTAQGAAFPAIDADHDLQKLAMERLKGDLNRHIQLTGLMAWRGFWSFPTRITLPSAMHGLPVTKPVELLNLLAGLSLWLVLLVGLFRRQPAWVAYAVAPASMMALYALLSQGLPRFNAPANPLILMALLLLLHAGWQKWAARKGASLPAVTKPA